MALASNPTWADCAGALSGQGAFASSPGDTIATLTFDDDGAPLASIDFTILGVNVSANGLSPTSIDATPAVAAIPEPHTNLLMLAGLAAIGFMATRRRRP